jgi:hypothetical protein
VIEWISAGIVRNPGAVRWAGRILTGIGGGFVILGLRADWLLSKLTHRAAVKLEGPQTLAETSPTLSTWWIPETVFGYQLAVFCLLVGLAMVQLASSVLKSQHE